MQNEISHIGKITDITPEVTTVEIVSESACGSCHAKAFCGLGDARTKAVQLPTSTEMFSVGDTVNVNLRRSMGFKAVWLSYVIPLLVLLATLLPLLSFGIGELTSALIALSATAAYYFLIYLFRDKLKNEYSFYISRI